MNFFIHFDNLDLAFFLFVVFIDKEEDLDGGRWLQEQEQGRRRRGRRRQLEDIKVRQTNKFK